MTGFGPFLKVKRNPSGALAKRLAQQPPARVEVEAIVLPVAFEEVGEVCRDALERLAERGWRPDLLFGMGVQRKPWFRLEERARADLQAKRPDVRGFKAERMEPLPGGDLATEIDLEALRPHLNHRALERSRLSADAGGYVCERTYHALLTEGREREIPAFFLHVPPARALCVEEQLPHVRRALAAAVRSLP